jgi:hypothetical protein
MLSELYFALAAIGLTSVKLPDAAAAVDQHQPQDLLDMQTPVGYHTGLRSRSII